MFHFNLINIYIFDNDRAIGTNSTNNGNQIQSLTTAPSVSINFSAGSQVIILHSNSQISKDFFKSQSLSEKGTQACSMHLMDAAVFSRLSAAVALSELALTAPASQLFEKREVSTQTDNNIYDVWLNSSVQEETNSMESKVKSSSHFFITLNLK
jgi:hypothetical protein